MQNKLCFYSLTNHSVLEHLWICLLFGTKLVGRTYKTKKEIKGVAVVYIHIIQSRCFVASIKKTFASIIILILNYIQVMTSKQKQVTFVSIPIVFIPEIVS